MGALGLVDRAQVLQLVIKLAQGLGAPTGNVQQAASEVLPPDCMVKALGLTDLQAAVLLAPALVDILGDPHTPTDLTNPLALGVKYFHLP
jgi:hypothetical protein